jgi:hypothetical protein
MDWCRTTAWTIADNANPRMSAHRIDHAIAPARARAWPTASNIVMAAPVSLVHSCCGQIEPVDR